MGTANTLLAAPAASVEVLDTGHVAELARLCADRFGVEAFVQRPYPSPVV